MHIHHNVIHPIQGHNPNQTLLSTPKIHHHPPYNHHQSLHPLPITPHNPINNNPEIHHTIHKLFRHHPAPYRLIVSQTTSVQKLPSIEMQVLSISQIY